ncbi:MAG TPA: ATP-binding protein [Herpetosiphonaceae bacterium]
MLRQLQRRLGSRIRYKIILPYMLLAALMLVLLGILAFYTIATRLQAQLDLELRDRATNTSLELETIEARLLDEMKVVVGAPADPTRPLSSTADAFAASDTAQLATIARLASDFYQTGRILAFDTSGRVLVDQSSALVRDRSPSLEGQEVLASNPLVQAVLSGKVDEVGDKYASLLQFGGETPYTMFFVIAPVKQQIRGSSEDRIVGALLFAEPLDTIIQQVNQTNRATITAILDGQGRVLSSNAPNNNADMALSAEQLALLNDAAGERSLTSQLELSEQSYQVLYNPLRIRRQIDGFYAVALPRTGIAQTWAESRLAVGVIALLVLCGVIFIGNSITRRITTPLSELASTALEVKSGQLERRSAIQREDEVGTLAGVLNEMTDRLLDLYRTSRQIGAELSIEGVLAQTAAAARRVLPDSQVSALLYAEQEWLFFGPERREVDAPFAPATLGELPVISEREDGAGVWPALHRLRPDAWLALPLRTQQQSIGLLLIGPEDAEASLAAITEPLSAVASMTATALQNAMLYVTMQDEAGRKQAILQSIADGVVVLDSDGRVILANSAATDMLDTAQVLGRTLQQLPLKPLQPGVEIFAENGAPTLYESGERIIRLSAAPVQGLEGRQTGEVLVLHDVTAEREVDRAKTDFIATISHELRTPLTSICGYTDLLLRGLAGPLAAEQTEFLTTIRQQSQSMVDVLQNVIIIASIEAGTMAPHVQSYPAAELVDQALPAVRKAIEAKGVKLQVELQSGLPPVLVDRDHFKIIMVQLLDNARRYTHDGAITVRGKRDEGMVRFEVADTGQGIAAPDQARLFTRFQRGGEQSGLTSKERGAGLGLAIARQLVENLGGRIWVDSAVGQGSTFTFVVPYDNAQPAETAD